MEPLLALGRFGLQGGELGFNEPRHLDTLWHSGNSQTPADLRGNGGHFTYFPNISNNQGT
jgi:hypothetical protein